MTAEANPPHEQHQWWIRRCSDQRSAARIDTNVPAFGPLYRIENSRHKLVKEEAWKHVLGNSDPESKIQKYLSAIRNVRDEARNMYHATLHITDNDFEWMMVKDGCFFLQMVFHLLGRGTHLGYRQDRYLFEEYNGAEGMKLCVESMLFVGNQIPLIVLSELMKQDYFQESLAKRKWKRHPTGLFKQVLYDLLILPALPIRNCCNIPICAEVRASQHAERTRDILHGLHMAFTARTGKHSKTNNGITNIDLEGQDIDLSIENAMNLRQKGLRFKVTKQPWIRGIEVKTFFLCGPTLYLPQLFVDNYIDIILPCLSEYEFIQNLRMQDREVSAYLKFMTELITGPADAQLLANANILKGCPIYISRLNWGALFCSGSYSSRLHSTRLKIVSDLASWMNCSNFYIASFVALMTIVQVIVAIVPIAVEILK